MFVSRILMIMCIVSEKWSVFGVQIIDRAEKKKYSPTEIDEKIKYINIRSTINGK